ncbi:CLK4-associating serine/arginine rich protein-like [Gadus chalcogrammus]|uniref:CLK4-associating serine/arginine rich protein-like n=1 Tax=Gadus chalcogrammus TaxID=1042646 RepID=UPI0024C3D5F5|nr:CLK4-associating serine/arginine rich protein-like [Gadus chalcogrammus]
MLGQVLRERGVVVRHGVHRPPQQPPAPPPPPATGPQSRHSEVHHGSEAPHGDPRPHQRDFERSSSARHSYHGGGRERRRNSSRSDGDHRDNQERQDGRPAPAQDRDAPGVDREPKLAKREAGGGSSRWWRAEPRPSRDEEEGHDGEGSTPGHRVRVSRSTSERWYRRRGAAEPRWEEENREQLNREEEVNREEVRREDERPRLRVPQRSQSMTTRGVLSRLGWRPTAAGSTLPPPQPREGCLDLGALQQVLQDQELALRLQEEEERRARRGVRETARNSYHEGDFRVAQVAQDEEIARFIQKQEIKSRRRSRELDGPASWREHREMISHPERTAPRDPQGQGKRRDSEDLPSPTEEHSPENQPPSPISDLTQTQVIRNIAEELDPTFRAPGPGNPTLKTGPAGPSCPSVPVPPSGPSCVLEEPTFIPPTKRQPDKSGRKPKEKKENCKQQ